MFMLKQLRVRMWQLSTRQLAALLDKSVLYRNDFILDSMIFNIVWSLLLTFQNALCGF